MKRSLSLCFVALSLTSYVFSEEQPTLVQFVRPLGMGGAFTAVADDHNIFTFNPAGMVQRTGGQFTLLELAGGVSTDFKTAVDYINDNKDTLTNLEDHPEDQAQVVNDITNTISKLDPRAYVAADVASYVSGPKFLGLPAHVGFGAFGVADATFHLDAGGGIPTISFAINNDIVLPLSIAHRWNAPLIPGRIGVGLTGKYIVRNQMQESNISVATIEDLEAPPLSQGRGIGSDLGLLYQPNDRLNVGVMVQDFLGTKMHFDKVDAEKGYAAREERDTVIRPRTNLGVAVTPKKLLWLIPSGERWTFAFDIRDVVGSEGEHVLFQNGFNKPLGENFGTHAHLGAEFRYFFLRFRGGAYQGYPSFGLGIDIPLLKLDYAFYSRELGLRAGDHQEKNHVVSLALRFGSGATESRERIKKSKDAGKLKGDASPETDTQVAPEPTKSESAPPAKSDAGSKKSETSSPGSQEAIPE